MNPQKNTRELPPFPNGWYALATSKELKKGAVKTKKLAGKDVVLYRTESGKACAMQPFCPHLGAHFGHGGKVEGETIRCPFHGFCFDKIGTCTKTAYGSRPSRRAKTRMYPIHEVNGFLMVYYHETGEAPDWFIPKIKMDNWTPLQYVEWQINSHPQEITENSVDVGHFNVTHGFEQVEIIQNATMNAHYLTARYAMSRPSFLPKILPAIRTEFEVHVHGLGYSFVEVKFPKLQTEIRVFVQPIPLEAGKIILRLGIQLKQLKLPVVGSLKPLNWLLSKIILQNFTADVAHDLVIWENKQYVERPLLALGDGPIAEYRLWAKQFYTLKCEEQDVSNKRQEARLMN